MSMEYREGEKRTELGDLFTGLQKLGYELDRPEDVVSVSSLSWFVIVARKLSSGEAVQFGSRIRGGYDPRFFRVAVRDFDFGEYGPPVLEVALGPGDTEWAIGRRSRNIVFFHLRHGGMLRWMPRHICDKNVPIDFEPVEDYWGCYCSITPDVLAPELGGLDESELRHPSVL
ncbi:MAG: hypothetical protein AAF690_16085 [Acidobacteriota bacterium]